MTDSPFEWCYILLKVVCGVLNDGAGVGIHAAKKMTSGEAVAYVVR